MLEHRHTAPVVHEEALMFGRKAVLAAAVAGLSFLGLAQSSQASSFMSLIGGEANIVSDDNREVFVERGVANGDLDVGDSIRGIITLNQLYNTTGAYLLGGSSPNTEVTAIFQIQVTSKVAVGGGNFALTYGPDAAFAAEFGAAAGTMIIVYQDAANNVVLDGAALTRAASEASATDGSPVWYLGFTGAAGEGWASTGPTALAVFNSGIGSGFSNFSVNRTSAAGLGGPLYLVPQPGVFGGATEFVGTSLVRGAATIQTPWQLMSDSTITFVVPSPAAVLGGAGLLGALGAAQIIRRRRA